MVQLPARLGRHRPGEYRPHHRSDCRLQRRHQGDDRARRQGDGDDPLLQRFLPRHPQQQVPPAGLPPAVRRQALHRGLGPFRKAGGRLPGAAPLQPPQPCRPCMDPGRAAFDGGDLPPEQRLCHLRRDPLRAHLPRPRLYPLGHPAGGVREKFRFLHLPHQGLQHSRHPDCQYLRGRSGDPEEDGPGHQRQRVLRRKRVWRHRPAGRLRPGRSLAGRAPQLPLSQRPHRVLLPGGRNAPDYLPAAGRNVPDVAGLPRRPKARRAAGRLLGAFCQSPEGKARPGAKHRNHLRRQR